MGGIVPCQDGLVGHYQTTTAAIENIFGVISDANYLHGHLPMLIALCCGAPFIKVKT